MKYRKAIYKYFKTREAAVKMYEILLGFGPLPYQLEIREFLRGFAIQYGDFGDYLTVERFKNIKAQK